MRYLPLVLGACGLAAAWQLIAARPLEWSPGVLAASIPSQTDLQKPDAIALKGFDLTPRARFSAEVRVLARSRYWLGTLATVSPLDVAVGWGPMSDSSVLEHIDVSQSGRFYFWRYEDEPPIAREAIESHSANWHLVPASDSAWRALRGLRVGDIVTLEGMLVDVTHPDIGTMTTSLRRDDTGAGACEIVLVETASLRYR